MIDIVDRFFGSDCWVAYSMAVDWRVAVFAFFFGSDGRVAYSTIVDRFVRGRCSGVFLAQTAGWLDRRPVRGWPCSGLFLAQTAGWIDRWLLTGSWVAVFGPFFAQTAGWLFGSDGRVARAMEVENLDGVWCASVFGTTGWRVTLETINPFNPGMDRDRRGMQYGS